MPIYIYDIKTMEIEGRNILCNILLSIVTFFVLFFGKGMGFKISIKKEDLEKIK